MLIKIILYALALSAFFVGSYYAMRYAIHDEIAMTIENTISKQMREEFEHDRQTYKFIMEEYE